MSRRRLPLLLAVIGVVVIAVSVIAASVVRSSDTATLRLGEHPDVPVVITEPGVLDAVDPRVTVRATAQDDAPVVLAVGRTAEVEAWLGDADHARVTGLSSWEELTVEVVTGTEPTDPAEPADAPGEPTEAPTEEPTAQVPDADPTALPNPAGSDLWVAEAVGTGSAELTWIDTPGRWSLVAATDGTGPAPEIELEWGRQVSTPWLVPGIVVGAIVLVAGATMFVLDLLARREQRRRDEVRRQEEDETRPRVSVTDTDPTGERLTRRQIREMERAMARADRERRAGESVAPIPLAGTGSAGSADTGDTGTDDAGTTARWFARSAGRDTAAADAAGERPDQDQDGAGPPTDRTAADAVQDGPGRRDESPAEPSASPDVATGATDVPTGAPAGATDSAAETTDSTAAPTTESPDEPTRASDEPAGSPEERGDTGPDATPRTADGGTTGAAPGTLSWRSVWGFGGAATGETPPGSAPSADQDDEGEERR